MRVNESWAMSERQVLHWTTSGDFFYTPLHGFIATGVAIADKPSLILELLATIAFLDKRKHQTKPQPLGSKLI